MSKPKCLPSQARRMPLPAETAKDQGPPRLSLAMSEDNVLRSEMQGDWTTIGVATQSPEVVQGLIRQLAILGEQGRRVSEVATNQALAFVSEMKPRDPAELLLFAQMAAVHQATMTLARRLNHVDTIPQQDAAERALNKLARTFAGQMETLKRYRSKGQQVVRVERVTVQEGGQAIVGQVTHGGGDDGES